VRLRVAAKPSAIENRGTLPATCRFDLSGLGEGVHSLAVQAAEINLPKGVTLMEPVAPTLTIRLEKKVSKTVDVVAELEGELSPGVAVVAVRLKPDRVRLTGTAAMLDGVDTIKTRPISLKGASESFKKEIPLNLPEAIVVASASRLVVAEVEIRERLITKLFEDIPIRAKGKTTGFRIQPQGITLTISGPEEIVSKIESNPDFSVTIDLEGLAPGQYSLKAAIKLPLHTTLDQVAPELFSVTISK
jgi:YbbR domain-containing protein